MTMTSGVVPTGSILDTIVQDKQDALERRKKMEPESLLRGRLRDLD